MNFPRSINNYKNKWVWWILLLLVVWGVWLYNLNLGDFSFDETATYFVAYRPPLEILQYLRSAGQEHPPVYYLLIRGWMGLTGTGEFSLRYFSLLVGLLALVLAGWLARLVAHWYQESGRGLGLVTAVLLAATPGMAYYARDARMYSLLIVWAILAAGLLLRDWVAIEEWPRWTAVFALILINGVALFTHYYYLLFLITQPLVLLATRRWRPFWIWTAVNGLIALVGLLWLWLASGLQKTLIATLVEAQPGQITLSRIIGLLRGLLATDLFDPQTYLLPIVLLLVAGGVLIAWRRQWRIGVWLLLVMFLPLLFAFLIPRLPQARYLIYMLPFVALAMSHTLLLPKQLFPERRWLGGVLALALTAGAIWLLAGAGLKPVLTLEKTRYSHTLQVVSSYQQPGDEVLFYGPWQLIPFHYYDPGNLPPITVLPPSAPPLLDPTATEPVLTDLLARAQRLWVVPVAVDAADPEQFVWEWLRTHAHAVWQQADLHLYLPPLPTDAPTVATAVTFGEAIRLEQIAIEPGLIPAGEPVRLTLSWRFLQRKAQKIWTTLSLVNSEGQVWQTADFFLENDGQQETLLDHQGLLVPQGAPPGEYTLQTRLVDVATDTPLLVDGMETAVLQTIQIVEPVREPVLEALPALAPTSFCQPDHETCINLVGVEPGGVQFQPGYPVPFKLHWQAPTAPLPELQVRLQLRQTPRFSWPGSMSTSILTQTVSLTPEYSAPNWSVERLVTLPDVISLPADAPPGQAEVMLEVLGADGTPWITPENTTQIPLFPILVEARPTLKRLPAELTTLEADFGAEVGLRGYQVTGRACPGEQIELTYAWYAHTRPSTIYAVFNHLLGASEELVAQVDGWPQGGRLLTTQWQPGEYIVDNYKIPIPLDAPPGPYTLYVGFYNAADGSRLPASQQGQRLSTDRVPIPLPASCE